MPSRRNRWLMAAGLLLSLGQAPADEIMVSAAASLTDAFEAIGQTFEARHPGTAVRFNFGASDALVQQLAAGAPVDVLATADQESMHKAVARKLVEPAARRDFARNTLVAVVPADREIVPRGIADLARADIERIAVGQPESVPVGRYARAALEKAGHWAAIARKAVYALNVRQALDYVAREEVDAAFVYATDAAIRKDEIRVAFTVATEVPIRYPIAVVAGRGAQAQVFVDYVLSPTGQAILNRYGFLPP